MGGTISLVTAFGVCFRIVLSNEESWMNFEDIEAEVINVRDKGFRDRLSLKRLLKECSCTMMHIHAVSNSTFLGTPDVDSFLRHQREWSIREDPVCFFSLYPAKPGILPTVKTVEGATLRSEEERNMMEGYRARYDFTLALISAINNHQVDTYLNWILYSDVDILFTNKNKLHTYALNRLDGFTEKYSQTTETAWCGDGNIQPCDEFAISKAGRHDVTLILGTDRFPYSQAVINSGVFLARASKVTSFIFECALSIFNITIPETSFDAMDQGRLEYVLQETFNLNHDYLRSIFAPLNETLLAAPCLDDQVLMFREFDLTKALAHPLFGAIAEKHFPDKKVPDGTPSIVAIVCSKWMNSGACMWQGRFLKRRQLTWFTCGDFAAHFFGCGFPSFRSKEWREEIASTRQCRSIFPWTTGDAADSSFDWTQFLNYSYPMDQDGKVYEPIARPWKKQRRCDSLGCVEHGLENSPHRGDKMLGQYRYKAQSEGVPPALPGI
eukprot:Gregarina_sp_Poly_1__1666@NODE_1427_length_4171_cov_112_011452_g949_i0_p2_GENE_NODE_1427_length_4171_cov_112_011452_g949_i0NODE_1427_length_4171_cov_112_011452_g949_i0_p2_ORF_typecomplete_len496_score55_58Glyco_transf_34/PF05637_12/6_5e05Nucleotid_trans/PF03407_16/0_2_NODE_1427_length_4171_cov_112_011452_g949_i01701657